MELRQIRYAVAVADAGTFTAAARQCHVAQSALSHQIARLERELGAQLFARTSRNLDITAAGQAFVAAGRRALAAVDHVRAEVAASAGRITGPLRVGAIPTLTALGLAPVIASFRADHPDVDVALAAAASDDLIGRVRNGELDVAFVGVPPHVAAPGVRERELVVEELVALLPAGVAEPSGPCTLSDLASWDFVDFARGTAARDQTDVAFDRAGVSRRVAYEVGTIEFAEDFVVAGLGVALVPAGYRVLGDVRRVRIADPPLRSQRVVWANAPTPAALAFLAQLDFDVAREPSTLVDVNRR